MASQQRFTGSWDRLASTETKKATVRRIWHGTSAKTLIERPYTSPSNRARLIAEGRSAAKAQWEANKCSKHFSYRLIDKMGTKRPVLMTSVPLLTSRFYRLKCRHLPTGVNKKWFGHQEDDKCGWCSGGGRMAAQMWEYLFRHCSQWRDQRMDTVERVGKGNVLQSGQMQTRAAL